MPPLVQICNFLLKKLRMADTSARPLDDGALDLNEDIRTIYNSLTEPAGDPWCVMINAPYVREKTTSRAVDS